MSEDIFTGYYLWLCGLVKVNQETKSYFLLMKELQAKAFYSIVPHDDNRGEEGKLLRDQYEDVIGVHADGRLGGVCSMLEMLIALAYRGEALEIEGMSMSDWFWKMMENAGLDQFTDEKYVELYGMMAIGVILNRILDRTYHRTGKGGLFPLRHSSTDPKRDMKKVELWYQMNDYVLENYYKKH